VLVRRLLALTSQGEFAMHVRSIGRDEIGRLVMAIQTGMGRLRGALGGGQSAAASKEVHAPHMAFMRAPLFLFCFAEEFARSFFPLYTNDLAERVHGISSSLLASLPITVFMLLVAAFTPISAVWSDRHGRRPIFLIGAILSTLGLALSAIAGSYWEVLGYRAMSGIGYAMVFIASQGYVLDNTTDRDRGRGMAVYVAAITGADVAGPPIGGILSDQIGFRDSLLVAAACIAASAVLAWMFLHDEKHEREERRPLKFGDVLLLLQNLRFTSQMICISIPAKLLLAGFLFYLVPLHVSALGESEATIGRVIMVYALASIAVSPLAARVADRYGSLQTIVVGGAMVSGIGITAVFVQDSLISLIIAVAALGIGQACTISAQLSLVTRYAHDEIEWLGRTTVVSVFRLVERIGGVIGPLGAGAMLVTVGAREAMIGLGTITVAGAVLQILILCFLSRREKKGTAP
jgi:predicted MFS family arabinose efflux permease